MAFLPLSTDQDLQDALKRSHKEPILIFKHSNRCSLSSIANREMAALDDEAELPIFRVVVQQARPVSDAIAKKLNIRHETPQVLLIDEGEPVFDTSHRGITANSILDTILSTR